jgi:hypothetical protein
VDKSGKLFLGRSSVFKVFPKTGSGGILAGKQPFWAFLKKNFKFLFGRLFRLWIEYQAIGVFSLPWLDW